MKRLLLLAFSMLSINALGAVNSEQGKITSIESRSSGYHALYFSKEIPSQTGYACSLNDRAIIDDTEAHGSTLTSIALAAFTANTTLVIQVTGCVSIAGTGTTAPKVTKLQIYR